MNSVLVGIASIIQITFLVQVQPDQVLEEIKEITASSAWDWPQWLSWLLPFLGPQAVIPTLI